MDSEEPLTEVQIRTDELTIKSKYLKREVTCVLYLPAMEYGAAPLHLLLLNDGQDLEPMNYGHILYELYCQQAIKPVLTVGIKCGDRLQEYGISKQADFQGRGAGSKQYRKFIVKELLPAITHKTSIETFASYTIAGFSLGALSAFDIAWNHADIFTKVGAFSGSFWWRSKDLNDGYIASEHRIAHKTVAETKKKPPLKFWFMVGTKDETDDRDGNGIIDSIDDTTGLIAELYKKGYRRDKDVTYLEIHGGRHDVPTWGSIMPKFLLWAFKQEG